MSLNMTTFEAALKQVYTSDRIENMVYKDNPFLAMVSKYESFGGENLKLPIKFGIPQGRSITFANAQANKTNTQLKAFLLTRIKDYSLASIDNETIEASKGNSNAFMEAATVEIDGAIESATRSLASSIYRSGSGSIGQVLLGSTSNSFTLTNAEDVVNFEVGMTIVFSATDGLTSVESGTALIVGVDREFGIITVSAALTSINGGAGPATNDFVFVQGDYAGKISGLSAWLPNVAPVPGNFFFGVDRSADPSRLAGIRYDGSALPIEEALVSAAALVGREGGNPDYCFLAYSKYAELEKALGSKVIYTEIKVKTEIGFRGILVHGPRGPIAVVPDQNCPHDHAFMLSMQYWKLYSLGKCPKILDTDGLKMLRDSSADSVEVRIGYYAQLGCRAPGFNCNIYLG